MLKPALALLLLSVTSLVHAKDVSAKQVGVEYARQNLEKAETEYKDNLQRVSDSEKRLTDAQILAGDGERRRDAEARADRPGDCFKGKRMELNIRKAASLLGVSENTIYRWIEERRIPAYRVNESYRFNEAELLEWANSNPVHPPQSLIEGGDDGPLCRERRERGGIVQRLERVNQLIKEEVSLGICYMVCVGRGDVSVPPSKFSILPRMSALFSLSLNWMPTPCILWAPAGMTHATRPAMVYFVVSLGKNSSMRTSSPRR